MAEGGVPGEGEVGGAVKGFAASMGVVVVVKR